MLADEMSVFWSSLVGQRANNQTLSLLWWGFNSGFGTSMWHGHSQKKKKKSQCSLWLWLPLLLCMVWMTELLGDPWGLIVTQIQGWTSTTPACNCTPGWNCGVLESPAGSLLAKRPNSSIGNGPCGSDVQVMLFSWFPYKYVNTS